MMKRSTVNFVVDVLTLLVVLMMIYTGLLLKWVLPPGSGHTKVLWGYARHDWGQVHFWIAVALGGLLLVHLFLHWTWICAMVAKAVRHGKADTAKMGAKTQYLYGLGILAAVVVLFVLLLSVASMSVEKLEDYPRHQWRHRIGL